MPIHRFTVPEYYRLGEIGVLHPDAKVELLDGQVVDIPPPTPRHASVVTRLIQFFGGIRGGRWLASSKNPVHLDDYSEPVPDLMLVKTLENFYVNGHPRPEDVFLLIEVGDDRLDYDREEKLPRYGRAGIAEVWIVNLVDRTIEVYRDPHFTGYGSATILHAGDKASPAAFPDVVIDVASLVQR